jgi:hypothetical protein
MAQVKIKDVSKRFVTVDVTWDDGLELKNYVISNVPVESMADAQKYLFEHISGIYAAERAKADAEIYANPVIDPLVLQAVGLTFDNNGNIVS